MKLLSEGAELDRMVRGLHSQNSQNVVLREMERFMDSDDQLPENYRPAFGQIADEHLHLDNTKDYEQFIGDYREEIHSL